MAQLFYNLLLTALALPAIPVAGVALALRPRYRLGLTQRLGFIPSEVLERVQGRKPIWIHAPSVGEMLATRPFLQRLKQRFPNYPLLLSCLTPTAYATAREKLPEADALIYFPLDHPFIVKKVLARIEPTLFLFTETEMWPNFLTSLAQRRIPTMLVSGRFSTRAGERYRLLSPLFTPVFQRITLSCMQTQADAERFIQAGANPTRVVVTGNFKVDGVTTGVTQGQTMLSQAGLADRPTLIAASTHAGEEEVLLDAYRQLQRDIPSLLLIVAPRHPQRFTEVEQLISNKGYRYCKRSQTSSSTSDKVEVFLLDTLGELSSLYAAASLVFVGGSLIKGPGGHSVIEPALAQVPMCFGPYTRNFTTVVSDLIADGGGFQIDTAERLVHIARPLLTDDHLRTESGRKALAVIRRGQGAVERTIAAVEAIMKKEELRNAACGMRIDNEKAQSRAHSARK